MREPSRDLQVTLAPDVELARLRSRLWLKAFDQAGSVGRRAVAWLGVGWVAHEASGAIKAVAGTTTTFDAAVKVAMNMSMSQWFAWSVAAVFGGAYALERRSGRPRLAKAQAEAQNLRKRLHPEKAKDVDDDT